MENVVSGRPLGEDKVEPLSWLVDTPGGRYWAEFERLAKCVERIMGSGGA